MEFIIRKAKEEDAKEIAYVNTYTWLTTYKGLMPDELLEERVKTIDDRVPKIINAIKTKDNFYVALDGNKVVGIMSYGKSRNQDYIDSGEIKSIYILKDYQGLGLGKSLFMTGIKELLNMGFNSMILNVLEGNDAFLFYQKYGGKKVSEKIDDFGGTILKENVMYFDNLEDIYSKFNNSFIYYFSICVNYILI